MQKATKTIIFGKNVGRFYRKVFTFYKKKFTLISEKTALIIVLSLESSLSKQPKTRNDWDNYKIESVNSYNCSSHKLI